MTIIDDDDIKGDIRIILHRLSTMETTLSQIHTEVKRTNGRVTELEKIEARTQGMDDASAASKRTVNATVSMILGGGVLALVVWFVGHSING
jgi:hypothetical protein